MAGVSAPANSNGLGQMQIKKKNASLNYQVTVTRQDDARAVAAMRGHALTLNIKKGDGVAGFTAAILLLRKYLRTSGLPFGIGWWALTFPLGAYTVSTLTLARALKVDALEIFGLLLFVLLAAFWIVVTGRTLIGVRTGEAWRR